MKIFSIFSLLGMTYCALTLYQHLNPVRRMDVSRILKHDSPSFTDFKDSRRFILFARTLLRLQNMRFHIN